MVQVALRPAGREPWIWIVGLAAIGALVALGLGMRSWLATPPPSGGRHADNDRRDERAPRAAPSGRAGRTAAARPAYGGEPEASSEPGAPPPEPDDPSEPLDPEGSDAPELAGEERTGIALFPARGTKPIKRGIVVPDDFPLPPGYVRHFQTTDKGRMLPGILTFHEDYQPLDANGAPIPVPPDRVVPRELAPPGLPIEMLEVSKEDLEIEPTGPEPDQDGADSDP